MFFSPHNDQIEVLSIKSLSIKLKKKSGYPLHNLTKLIKTKLKNIKLLVSYNSYKTKLRID